MTCGPAMPRWDLEANREVANALAERIIRGALVFMAVRTTAGAA
jgi:hypothetical protein